MYLIDSKNFDTIVVVVVFTSVAAAVFDVDADVPVSTGMCPMISEYFIEVVAHIHSPQKLFILGFKIDYSRHCGTETVKNS